MPVSLSEALDEVSNEPWTGFLAVKSADKKVAKNGKPYLRISLGDNETAVAANVWDDKPLYTTFIDGTIKVGDHVKVSGRVSTHPQYGRQIDLSNLRAIEVARDAKDGYSPEALVEKAGVDLEDCWTELEAIMQGLRPEPLRDTVIALFAEHGDRFRRAAAAKNAHHAYFGGLLHHTTMMTREARAVMNVRDFPDINPSLVLAGILLHDLGKTAEMELYPRTEYTEMGNLLGHTQLVLGWLDKAAAANGFSGPLLLHLKHIILSHHGEHEYGAAVLPQTKEALFVHIMDNLDAKMQMAHYALSRLSDEESMTERLWAMGNRSFRPTPED